MAQSTTAAPGKASDQPDSHRRNRHGRSCRGRTGREFGAAGRERDGHNLSWPELVAKRLQLLSEVVPQLSRVAVLWHPRAYSDRTMAGMLKEIESAAQTLAIQLQLVPAAGPNDIADAFSTMIKERAAALMVFPSPMLFAEYPRIASLASDNRLPAIYAAREGAAAGGLMSYGANLPNLSRQTATYVHKILKGAQPADLPVQQPTKFELVINLKAAKALGLTVPPTLLGSRRSDRIEMQFVAPHELAIRDNPLGSKHCQMREFDRDLIRGGHYGQRSCEPRQKAGHMAAPTNAAEREESPCQPGAVHT